MMSGLSNLELLKSEYPETYQEIRFKTINEPLFKEWLDTIDMEYVLQRLNVLDDIPVPNQKNLVTIMYQNDVHLAKSVNHNNIKSFSMIEYVANNLNWVLKRINGSVQGERF